MPEKEYSNTQPPDYSYEQLYLKAYNFKIIANRLGIISNEIQAFGSILESIGAAITVHGNMIGQKGFEMETAATKLHIMSVTQELEEKNKRPKSNLLLQLKAYNILLIANKMGVSSNAIQAAGAVVQTAAGIIIAYGNLLTVTAFELEMIVTKLEIEALLLESEKQKSQVQSCEYFSESQLSKYQQESSSQKAIIEQLCLKMNQMQESVNKQQAQIQEILVKMDKF